MKSVAFGRCVFHDEAMADGGAPVPPFRTPEVPIDDVVGRPTVDVRELYLMDGFQVEVVDIDDPDVALAASIAPDRIRLFVRAGRVVRAAQG